MTINNLIIYVEAFNFLNFEYFLNKIIKEYEIYSENTLELQLVLYKYHEIIIKNITSSYLKLSFKK